MAESAALNSRQISRMHNKATSHGNPLSLSLSISISLSRRAEKKNDRPPSFFLFFVSFSNWQRSVNLTGKNTYHYQIRFRVGAEGFYREAIVLAFLFLFRRASTTLKRERGKVQAFECLKHSSWIVDTTEFRGSGGGGGGGKASDDRSRSKHFHGEKDAEVDKDETCQKEGGNNESAVASSRPSTAGSVFWPVDAQTMRHRNCQMYLQVPPVPERKTASKYVQVPQRSLLSIARIYVWITCRTVSSSFRLVDQSNRRTSALFPSLLFFFLDIDPR